MDLVVKQPEDAKRQYKQGVEMREGNKARYTRAGKVTLQEHGELRRHKQNMK